LKEAAEKLEKRLSDYKSHIGTTEERISFLESSITELRKLMSPLLTNLKSSPDKLYLHWPNRVEQVAKFEEKLDAFVTEVLNKQ
jgi:predicted  nucleic acid-binding Zn-ribbon protein